MKINPQKHFGTRECPSCACKVPANNNRCPICNYEFPAHNRTFNPYVITVIAILLLCILLAGWIYGI